MGDIFVSYARADRDRVEPLVAALEREGWSVWWDPEITPGDDFEHLIAQKLEAAHAVIVVWTANSVSSRWVKGEARDAADRGVLAPVRFDGSKLPIDFRAIHTTDLDDWNNDSQSAQFQELKKSLSAKLAAVQREAEAEAEDNRPSINICVLPFANMSGDPEQDYFSDGVTEDIITDLSKVSALSVVSRNSAFAFKGKHVELKQVARQLSVSHVLEGSVRKAGDRVRITAQLVDAANDAHLWAERYDRKLDDIFALQDEISEAVVQALRLTLLPEEKRALEHRSTNNSEAYKLYLMARQFSIMGNERHQEGIVRICKRAVDLDPAYARAWATMALAQWELHRRNASEETGRDAADRAIALDPQLADAHAAVGACLQGDGDAEAGLAACAEAIKLEPDTYEGNRIAALCCMALRRYDDAIAYAEAAAAAVETEFYALNIAVQAYEDKGDRAGAKDAARRVLKRIESIIAAEPDHGRALAYGVCALASLGERDRAKEWAIRGQLLEPDNVILQFNLACAMSRMGEAEAAIDLLEGVIGKASKGTLMFIETDSDFDPIRDDPRFVAMYERAMAQFK